MKYLTMLGLLGMTLLAVPNAHAQRVVVGLGFGPAYVGPPPACVYGYYDYYPYACAPYGYYGADWFSGGVFIGAGPWFRGYYGRPGYYSHPGFYGRPGFRGRPFVRRDFDDRGRGFEGRGRSGNFRGGDFQGRGFQGNSFHGGNSRSGGGYHGSNGSHGGNSFQGGGGSRGGGSSHGGGGSHGGGHR